MEQDKSLKHMLVPLDGSTLAEVVIDYVGNIAPQLGARVTLFHVYPPEERSLLALHQGYINWAAYSLKSRLSEGGTEVAGRVSEGYPADEILRYCRENQVDLILMATHGRSGLSRWIMGSVSEKVLRSSKLPVWLIRGGSDFQEYHQKARDNIVVTLDGSKLAEQALPYAEALVKKWRPEKLGITLLSVSEPPNIPSDYPPDMPLTWEQHVEQEMKLCRQERGRYLQAISEGLSARGLRVTTEVLVGRATQVIADYINENPPRLLIMATHGRSGLSRWLMGSVAESVMGSVSAPVFLISPHSDEG